MLQLLLNHIWKLLEVIVYTVKNLPRDVAALNTLAHVKKKLSILDKKNQNVPEYFSKWVIEQPNKPCIIYNETTWTFKYLENYGNKIANFFSKHGLKKGDVVALLMENKPEYIGIWYGLSKLGCITACINSNLRSKSLIHCITVAAPKVLLYGKEFKQAVLEIAGELSQDIDHIVQDDADDPGINLENLIAPSSIDFLQDDSITGRDTLMYIYTSGTTGLPKPAIIKHNRYIAAGFSFFDSCKLNKNDVFLVTLPIYHSNAGCIGVGAALISGATIVLRKKFSATNFWKECIQYKVTSFCYVGEVCRYLVNQPVSKLDKAHSVRLCIGNGTRANIHKEFTERFNVKVMEIYGATEGNCILINNTAKIGACGYLPRINNYLKLLPTFVIRVDNDMNPIRDSNGFCIQCEPNERGILVGAIDPKITRQQYNGYANNTQASEKKIITDLFKKDECGFNTGDLMMSDKDGYIYFVDRLGDTFRWKGENVSTIEVENTLSIQLDSKEVVVYGVEIKGHEGKAGMATLMTSKVNITKLAEFIHDNLPPYAKPIFLRLSENVDHTGSMKAQKTNLIKEGFNINLFNDKTYYYDTKDKKYDELTKEIYNKIQDGKIRF